MPFRLSLWNYDWAPTQQALMAYPEGFSGDPSYQQASPWGRGHTPSALPRLQGPGHEGRLPSSTSMCRSSPRAWQAARASRPGRMSPTLGGCPLSLASSRAVHSTLALCKRSARQLQGLGGEQSQCPPRHLPGDSSPSRQGSQRPLQAQGRGLARTLRCKASPGTTLLKPRDLNARTQGSQASRRQLSPSLA